MNPIEALESFGLSSVPAWVAPKQKKCTFSMRPIRVAHETYAVAIRKIAAVHRRGQSNGHGGGLLLSGPSGTGKTSALTFYREHFPMREEAEGRVQPVTYVVTPSAPTVKSLAEAILIALGDPAHGKGSSEQKTHRIYKFLKGCKVELLMIDEFQHFVETTRRSANREVTDWLKNLISVSQVPVVLAGLPTCTEAIRSNSQLARRFSAHCNLCPFTFTTAPKRMEFRGVLAAIQKEIPIRFPNFSDANNANRMFIGTNGVIDYVAKLVDQAVDLATRNDQAEVTMDTLAQAFRDAIWCDAPDELNPFTANSLLQPLTKIGQPFEIHERVKKPAKNLGQKS